jgi:hypothetical protein
LPKTKGEEIMPKISGRITGSLQSRDAVTVSLKETADGADITSVTVTGPGEFTLEAPRNQKYLVCTDENCTAWSFRTEKIEADASNGDVRDIEFEAVLLVSARSVQDDDLNRQFALDILQSSLNSAPKLFDEYGVRAGMEIIRRTIFNALEREDATASAGLQQQQAQEQESSGQAPQQQQQWKATPYSLADEQIEPVQKYETLPTGEPLARPIYMLTCQYCYNRFNTPGTIFYRNQAELDKCLYYPPCT